MFNRLSYKKIEVFWDKKICGKRHSKKTIGTKVFFDEIKKKRYRLEPHIIDFVEFEKYEKLKVLEIGCGMGTDLINFSKNNKVTGIDISKESLKLAEKNFKLHKIKGNFLKANASNLPFKNESFDIIYSNGVIHHIHDVKKVVTEIYRVLKSNGKAIIMVYNKNSLLGLFFRTTGERFTDGIDNPYTKLYSIHDIKKLFKRFEIIKIKTYSLLPHIPLLKNIKKYGWFLFFEVAKLK